MRISVRIKIAVFLLLIFFSVVFAQDAARVGTYSPIFLQTLNIDAFNSIGFSNITNAQVSEIGSANPASLANFSSMSSGIQFQYNTVIDYYLDLELNRTKQWLPSSFGFVYPFNNYRIGLSYHQKYSSFLEFGEMEVRTVLQPQGTGEFYEASTEVIVHSPSVLISYSVPDLINEGDHFTFGGQLFWDFWEVEEIIWHIKGQLQSNAISWKLGIVYDFNSTTNIGLLYERGIEITDRVEYVSDTTIDPDIDTSGVWRVPVNYIEPDYTIKMPDRISFGVSTKLRKNFQLATTLTSIFWREINKEFKNQFEFSANVLYSYSEMYDFTFGVFVTDREINNQDLFNYNYPQNATYFNIGCKAKFDNIHLSAEILDSHLMSVDVREHTIFKLSFGYLFNDL